MQSTKLKEFDLDALPEEARKELMDFYEFLIWKYNQQWFSGEIGEIESMEKQLMADQIHIDTRRWKFTREEIYER